ncbi:uncharacterized protein N7459_009536 [Penicillium hispanicum]|uniref:uncharacterized protein n=1 Tax=Penicillium hispanicum TaxID=1080232 RepID=UPI00253FC469|nr:uncharacterized protein N7459_009536 [Penicillium hispanicum]KAJ5570106.1 hypothetical protein N7459_009536 [Penicillium hispanicum]
MAPSTVFSYWRRDHRRSTAPPASLPAPSVPKGATESPISTPPQLPEIPDTQTLTSPFDITLDGLSYDAPPWSDSPLESDPSKQTSTPAAVPLSSSYTLAVPSPLSEREHRPHSSPGEREPESVFTAQSNNSQFSVSGLRPDQGDGESNSKPTSPFRLSFGKGLRNLQSQANEPPKRSPTAATGTSQFRFKTSPDDTPVDKPDRSQRDSKIDAVAMRRVGDRDVPTDHPHHKSGKAMLHLLNPMSLLARRRSSQMSNSRVEEAKLGAPNLIPAIPDDYDPRIRGHIVHDFSAPRPRRVVSGLPAGAHDGGYPLAQELSPRFPGQSPRSRWSDQTKRHSDHSPVFKEHFEDDQHVLQPENKGYLQSTLLTNPSQHAYDGSVPVFAKKLPPSLPEYRPEIVAKNVHSPAELPAELPADVPVELPGDEPEVRPPANREDQDTIPDVPHYPAGLPKHLKSNASRFSFDMGGVESSVQEKLLEEKHKAKEAARKLEDGYFDDFDEEFDHDMLNDVDGLEERIPGVNADADDDYFDPPTVARNINGEFKSWATPGLSPVVASPSTPAPPSAPPACPAGTVQEEVIKTENSDIQKSETPPQPPFTNAAAPEPTTQHPHAKKQDLATLGDDDDDLYFDDGDFGDLTIDNQDGGFDESIFDDETSHLYERKPVGGPQQGLETVQSEVDTDRLEQDMLLEEDATQGLKHMPSVASEYRVPTIKRGPLGEPIPNMGPSRTHGGVLTEQNLEVLHNALAFAANEAASQSRFERTFSTSDRSLGQESISQTSHTGDSQPGLVSDDSRLSQGPDVVGFDEVFDDQIYDDDDAYYDDPIVAAANAEALENDDEGFYGDEFGFYAQAYGGGSSELTNGGYFGPRGIEGINRNHSSRGKFQEPSLTPITERSEWSTRNSVISLKAHAGTHSTPSLASPGLAQLVDMGNLDDEMSLSALMKLRRGAWGGSNGSLRSSAGSPPPHTLPSSNRGSFTGASEVSPSDARPSADEGLTRMGSHYDDSYLRATSPLRDPHLGYGADLPPSGIDGPAYVEGEALLLPNTGTPRPNVL